MSSTARRILIGLACLALLAGAHTAYKAHRRDLARQAAERAIRLAAKGGSSIRISVDVQPEGSDYFTKLDASELRHTGSDSMDFGLRDWTLFFSDPSGAEVRAEVIDREDRWEVRFEVPETGSEVPPTE